MLITKFVERLKAIGIEVLLHGNYPWIYLYSVNGNAIKERFMANHGFTAFMTHPTTHITNIREVFKIIRKYR